MRLLTLAAAVGSGCVGGVFFAFSAFVMRGLSLRPPAESIQTQQSINITVIHPASASFWGRQP